MALKWDCGWMKWKVKPETRDVCVCVIVVSQVLKTVSDTVQLYKHLLNECPNEWMNRKWMTNVKSKGRWIENKCKTPHGVNIQDKV